MNKRPISCKITAIYSRDGTAEIFRVFFMASARVWPWWGYLLYNFKLTFWDLNLLYRWGSRYFLPGSWVLICSCCYCCCRRCCSEFTVLRFSRWWNMLGYIPTPGSLGLFMQFCWITGVIQDCNVMTEDRRNVSVNSSTEGEMLLQKGEGEYANNSAAWLKSLSQGCGTIAGFDGA